MSRFTGLALSILFILSSSQLHAQDLLSSTGNATRSYSFVEFQYLPELADDTDGLPLLLNAIAAITDRISLTGEYQRVGNNASNAAGDTAKLEGENLQGGFLYHQEFPFLADSDWVAGLSVGRTRLEAERTRNSDGLRETAESTVNFQEVYAGLRRSFTDKIEGEAGLTVYRDRNDTDVTGNIRVILQ